MQNGTLVAMIDVCLERLQTVRRLLTTPGDKAAAKELLKVSEPRVAKAKKKARLQIKKKKTKDELTASLFEQTTEFDATAPEPAAVEPLLERHAQPDYVAPGSAAPGSQSVVKQPLSTSRRQLASPRRVTPASRKKAAAPAGALSGQVPTGPVFIPAAQVRSEHERKQAEAQAERNAFDSDSIPLTAESLARRWLQSANQ